MPTECSQQIEVIYHAALGRAPAARAAFLAEACAGDEDLRRKVEALLQDDNEAETLRQDNAFVAAAEQLDSEELQETKTLLTGQQLGAYKILSPLGKGGMGEVHLALDTRLQRKVALKLLPSQFTQDRERVRRFTQEARAASALNHPNILTIHEIGQTEKTHYIVTEYVEGETLRAQLKPGKLSLDAALDAAMQVAQALAAAHEAGIIHRDIKPENVMVRRDGLVKVLDFGLAKLLPLRNADLGQRNASNWIEEGADTLRQSPDDNPHSAFRIPHSTLPGIVMGTPRYMPPNRR